jgi:hypothetical protein
MFESNSRMKQFVLQGECWQSTEYTEGICMIYKSTGRVLVLYYICPRLPRLPHRKGSNDIDDIGTIRYHWPRKPGPFYGSEN